MIGSYVFKRIRIKRKLAAKITTAHVNPVTDRQLVSGREQGKREGEGERNL